MDYQRKEYVIGVWTLIIRSLMLGGLVLAWAGLAWEQTQKQQEIDRLEQSLEIAQAQTETGKVQLTHEIVQYYREFADRPEVLAGGDRLLAELDRFDGAHGLDRESYTSEQLGMLKVQLDSQEGLEESLSDALSVFSRIDYIMKLHQEGCLDRRLFDALLEDDFVRVIRRFEPIMRIDDQVWVEVGEDPRWTYMIDAVEALQE